jgi:nitronate monooxygenase
LDLGAVAAQIGTAFINTNESEAIPSYKQRLDNSLDTDSSLTRAFSGRWARGIRNEMMNGIEKSGIKIPPYPLQNSLTAKLRKLAQQNDDGEFTNIWAGQSVGTHHPKSSSDVFRELIKDL